jgi:hypothetical protein
MQICSYLFVYLFSDAPQDNATGSVPPTLPQSQGALPNGIRSDMVRTNVEMFLWARTRNKHTRHATSSEHDNLIEPDADASEATASPAFVKLYASAMNGMYCVY